MIPSAASLDITVEGALPYCLHDVMTLIVLLYNKHNFLSTLLVQWKPLSMS